MSDDERNQFPKLHSTGVGSAASGYLIHGTPSNPPRTCGDMALILRRDRPAADSLIKLFELLDVNECLTFEQIKEHAQLDPAVGDESVHRLIGRARREVIRPYGLHCDLVVSGRILSRLVPSNVPSNVPPNVP